MARPGNKDIHPLPVVRQRRHSARTADPRAAAPLPSKKSGRNSFNSISLQIIKGATEQGGNLKNSQGGKFNGTFPVNFTGYKKCRGEITINDGRASGTLAYDSSQLILASMDLKDQGNGTVLATWGPFTVPNLGSVSVELQAGVQTGTRPTGRQTLPGGLVASRLQRVHPQAIESQKKKQKKKHKGKKPPGRGNQGPLGKKVRVTLHIPTLNQTTNVFTDNPRVFNGTLVGERVTVTGGLSFIPVSGGPSVQAQISATIVANSQDGTLSGTVLLTLQDCGTPSCQFTSTLTPTPANYPNGRANTATWTNVRYWPSPIWPGDGTCTLDAVISQ
jgi:hypothetical protein